MFYHLIYLYSVNLDHIPNFYSIKMAYSKVRFIFVDRNFWPLENNEHFFVRPETGGQEDCLASGKFFILVDLVGIAGSLAASEAAIAIGYLWKLWLGFVSGTIKKLSCMYCCKQSPSGLGLSRDECVCVYTCSNYNKVT